LPAPTPAAAAGPDVKALLLTVVAEKTGYPVEMLTLEMHIEADLGIDSIKRVEILSAMQERAAGLPVVKAADLAALKTLGQIVEFLEGDARAPRAAAG
jgi:acyl carrier protein